MKIFARFNYKILVFTIFIILVSNFVSAVDPGNISVTAGGIFYAKLEGLSDTMNWAGIKVVSTTDGEVSTTSFTSFPLTSPIIYQWDFPGKNMDDTLHYYGAMFPSNFYVSNIINVSSTDLDEDELFSSDEFPIFYPDYSHLGDAPEDTFDSAITQSITVGGENFTVFRADIGQNIPYYLLKYNNSGNMTPLFLVDLQNATCYNSTSCIGEFLLPLTTGTSNDYNFFIISESIEYAYRVWVDGVETNTFTQTALPYNLTVEVSNLYTNETMENVPIAIVEEDSHNIFLPYRLSGRVSRTYSVGNTNENGKETFIAVPTIYGDVDDYEIYLGVKSGNYIISKETLYVDSSDTIVTQSKPLTPTGLFNNVKVITNTLDSIVDTLYKWGNEEETAKSFTIIYNDATNSFTGVGELNTGVPNVLSLWIVNGNPGSTYEARLKESNGYLILNPTSSDSPLTSKDRFEDQDFATGSQFVVTPTSYGDVTSNVTLSVVRDEVVIDSVDFSINEDLNIAITGTTFASNTLKTFINTMDSIVDSLFYALNY